MQKQDIRENKKTLSLSTRISIIVLMLIVSVTLVLVHVLHSYERDKLLATESAREHFRLNIYANMLEQAVNTLGRDVKFLSTTPPVQGIIRAKESGGYDRAGESSLNTWKRRMQEIFMGFAQARPDYFQIRFIGVAENGKELVRVDVIKGKSVPTPPDRLQSKAGRDYYQAIAKLRPSEVYISRINLNREWGKVQVPHIRTIRAGIPVFSRAGKLFGMIVINMNIGNLLDRIRDISIDHVQTFLINKDGDFLINPDKSREFGFDLGRPYSWNNEFPGINLTSITNSPVTGRQRMFSLASGSVYVSLQKVDFNYHDPAQYLTFINLMQQKEMEKRIAGASKGAETSIVFVAVLVALIIGMLLYYLFKPLRKLTYAAHAIGDGDYDVNLPDNKYGEIATLVRAFRGMMGGIRKREEKTSELNEKLKSSEKQANLIIDTAPEAIIVVDGRGNIARFNTQAVKLFGYETGEIIGLPLGTLIPERFRQTHMAHREAYCEEPSHRMMGIGRELYAVRKDGSEMPVEVGLGPMRIGDEVYVIAVLSDITERKRAEEALKNMNVELERRVDERTRQLVASNQELEQFAYVASHDLQEPLRMVASYLQLIEKRYKSKLDKDAVDFIDFAVDGANRMKQLINGLLEYSRVQTRAKEFELVDMGITLENVLRDLNLQVTERHATVTHDPLPAISGDASQIQRLLQNLINNAMKYCKNSSPHIHVGVERMEETNVWVPDYLSKTGWLFSVSDNGIGIDEEYSERIFQLFQRLHTRKEYPGTGLGLALCKRIVDRHGGGIWVKSKPGVGSIFYFVLSGEDSVDVEKVTDDIGSNVRLLVRRD